VVNSIVVSGLLVLIVFANFAYQLLPRVPIWLPYAGLFGSLALGYLIPLQSLFLPQVWLRIAVATAVLCIPVFFAGMVFIRSFGETEFSGDSLGWNLLGAVLGGMLETTSQATGMHALLIWAAFLYAGSWIARYWAKVDGRVSRVAAAKA
jgi:hypothetical protein